MPDKAPTPRITIRDVYEKQIVIETLMQQILRKLPEVSEDDIIIDKGIDKTNPYWDDNAQTYSSRYYRQNHPIEPVEKEEA